MLIENFAALLNAKPVGKDRWRAVCPCHDDTRPSLDISRGRVQPIMVICRVCDARAPEVAQALGLKVGDLYAEHIMTDQRNIVWIDPEGNIDLDKIGDTLDNLPDGSTYGRLKTLHLELSLA